MQLKQLYYIATKGRSRKIATTFGDLPDCLGQCRKQSSKHKGSNPETCGLTIPTTKSEHHLNKTNGNKTMLTYYGANDVHVSIHTFVPFT